MPNSFEKSTLVMLGYPVLDAAINTSQFRRDTAFPIEKKPAKAFQGLLMPFQIRR